MAVSDMVNLAGLLDEAKCFELVRQHRWPDGVHCPGCDSATVIRNGHDEEQRHRQRYLCKACNTVPGKSWPFSHDCWCGLRWPGEWRNRQCFPGTV